MAKSNKLYKNILVALDLTRHSDALLKQAARIAACTKATLAIAHVLAHTSIVYAGEFSVPIDVAAENMIRKKAKAQLAKFGKKYRIPEKSQFLKSGSIKTEITDLAKKIRADVIVVGTHSHSGIEALLGSQANAILHAAKCDVWVIRNLRK